LGVEHIAVKGFYLHMKLYFFETGGNFPAFTDSTNITMNALTSNEEFCVFLTGTVGDDHHREITA
jgi:HKD family nuclease